MNSGVKNKYKQTEVGMIPEDWDAKSIGDEIDLLTGFPFASNQYSKTGIKLLRGSNVKRGETDWNEDITEYWSQISSELKRYELKEGDVIIPMDGSLVGKSYAQLSESDLPCLLLQRVARIRSKKIDISYLKHFIGSKDFVKYCDSVKTVTAIPHISPTDIRNFTIPIPRIKSEQSTIAEVLTQTDSLIASLEKLIAKKEAVKKATMQQLLTGKKRLPGFNNVWRIKKIGELADIDTDNLNGNTKPDYVFNYISLEDVDYGVLKSFSEQVYATSPSRARRKVKQYDILFATVRPNLKSHLFIKKRINDFICSTGFSVLRCKEGISHPVFIYQHLFAYQVESQINKLLSGSNYPSINSRDVKSLEVSIPDYETQEAIAEIFMDMDNEIFHLTEKLNKTRMIKQAMMQTLLTGKIRLV